MGCLMSRTTDLEEDVRINTVDIRKLGKEVTGLKEVTASTVVAALKEAVEAEKEKSQNVAPDVRAPIAEFVKDLEAIKKKKKWRSGMGFTKRDGIHQIVIWTFIRIS
jgi:hypothetical protein